MTRTKEEFIPDFTNFIAQHYKTGGLPAATLGQLWKTENPDTDWQALGFSRMSDVISEITATSDIWTVVNAGTPQMLILKKGETPTPKLATSAGNWVPRLLQDVWSAFINDPKAGKRYVNRLTGVVAWGNHPEPDSEHTDWVEINPVAPLEQQNWAREFMVKMNLLDRPELSAAIEQDPWYVYFMQNLRSTPALYSAWNGFRTRRVGEYVEAWCTANGVSIAVLRTPENLPHKPDSRGTTLASTPVSGAVAGDHSKLRGVLIDAFSRLHTHEMLQVQLPTHALVAALRPDLLI